MSFRFPVRVYIEDTDAGGIVYYVNYLKFMERARTEFMRECGFAKTAIFAEDRMFVVADCQVKYFASARLDNLLEVSAKPIKVARSNIVFEQKVWLADQLLVAGTVRIACVRRSDGRPCAMPEAMLARLQQQTELLTM